MESFQNKKQKTEALRILCIWRRGAKEEIVSLRWTDTLTFYERPGRFAQDQGGAGEDRCGAVGAGKKGPLEAYLPGFSHPISTTTTYVSYYFTLLLKP
ncbi:hypothetical protein NQ317_016065 [Molorchus minor]|uniref:Uncharacterized protein n=1 Tax=Molorchus minor TaxID=1323400 RepID=A0ABQ9JE25_9CUCU|nr:hypothetical protein NQ317_016065 [Molorchus minor]